MKPRLTLCLLAMVLLSFLSCRKEVSDEPGNIPGNKGDFYATVNGSLWNADSLQLILVSSGLVSINGISKAGDQISIIVPEFKVGTYTLNESSVSYALYANLLDDVSNVFVSNTPQGGGTVVITSIDSINHRVSGNFQFKLVNLADNSTRTVTEGVFDYIPYALGGGGIQPPPGNESDTLKAVVDGVSFNAAQIQTAVQPSPSSGPSQLLISGISAAATQDISLLIPADVGAGTYNLDFATGQYLGIYYPLGLMSTIVMVSNANGSLTIISNDVTTKRISGTFSFTATPFTSGTPADITDGYFSLSY